MADVYFVCSDASYCHRYRGDAVGFLSDRDSFGGVTLHDLLHVVCLFIMHCMLLFI